MNSSFVKYHGMIFVGIVFASCTGCWREVHYSPKQPANTTAEVVDSPGDLENRTVDSPPAPGDSNFVAAVESTEVPAADLLEMHGASAEPDQDTQLDRELTDTSSQEPVARNDRPTMELPAPDSESTDAPTAVSGNDRTHSETASDLAPDAVSPAERRATRVEVMRPSRTALAVWQMSSKWSLAAAIYAKGLPEERYRDPLDRAAYAADLLGVELPAFPVSEGMALEATVISYLLDRGTATFVEHLRDEYVPEYQALAGFAIGTNALLLVYTPKSQQVDQLVTSIRTSAEDSGLPATLWAELVSMLERREPFAKVKQRVLSLHVEVGDYLAGESA